MDGCLVGTTTVAWIWVGMADILLYIIPLANINITIAIAGPDSTREWLEIFQDSSIIADTDVQSFSSET